MWNVFKILNQNHVDSLKAELSAYDEDINRANALLELQESRGYSVFKEVLKELQDQYEIDIYESDDHDKSRTAKNKVEALRELLSELNLIISVGTEGNSRRQEIVDELTELNESL